MVPQDDGRYHFKLPGKFEPLQIGQLDSNLKESYGEIVSAGAGDNCVTGLDCAACGAPDCKTLAEDIVTGLASRSDCVFLLRKQMGDLAEKLSELIHELPPVMKNRNKHGKDR